MPGPRKAAKDASEMVGKVGFQLLDLIVSYESLSSYFDDLAMLLEIRDKHRQHEDQVIECKEIFKFEGIELGGILMDVHTASSEDFRRNASDWLVVFERISKLLQRLCDLEETLYRDYEADYININRITIDKLRRRYQRRIFDYFLDLF
jgi:hypothetical protein